MEGVDSYSVFTLYNPYRLVIDFQTGALPRRKLPVRRPRRSAQHGAATSAALRGNCRPCLSSRRCRTPTRVALPVAAPEGARREPRRRRRSADVQSRAAVRSGAHPLRQSRRANARRQVLVVASARARRVADRDRRRARRPRSRRPGQRHQRVRADARRRAAAREAAAEAAGRRGGDDARHRRVHPARGTHGDRQPRRRGSVPVHSRQREPQRRRRAASKPIS